MRKLALLERRNFAAEGGWPVERLTIFRIPWLCLHIDCVTGPDQTADQHDHASWQLSLILSGACTEQVYPDKGNWGWSKRQVRGRWSLQLLPKRAAHRTVKVKGPLWIIVLAGSDGSGWGFWRYGAFVPWQRYLSALHAPKVPLKTPTNGSRHRVKQPWSTQEFPAITSGDSPHKEQFTWPRVGDSNLS